MSNSPLRLLPWLLAPLLELPFAYLAVAPPEPWRVAAEIGAFGVLGLLQWRFARRGPLASSLVPAVLLVAGAAVLHAPAGLLTMFCYGLGVLLLSVVFLRVSEPIAKWPVGLLAVLLAAPIQRLMVLGGSYVGDPAGELAKELGGMLPAGSGQSAGQREGQSAGQREGQREGQSAGPPIVLISVDTLRWDTAQDMQCVQRIAAGGAYWPRAMATSSWTLPSLASLMSGLLPGEHGAGAGDAGYQSVRAEIPLIAEQLRAQGYSTAAFVANPFASSSTGLERGFEDFYHVNERASHRLTFASRPVDADSYWAGDVIVDRAIDWIGDAPETGFFVWIHLLDMHLPHQHAAADSSVRGWRRSDYLNAGIVSPDNRQDTRAGYAGEAAYVDAQVLRVLDALAARGLEEQALIVFTADHGEELWDHGGFEHGHSHAGQVVDVPLAMRHPGFVQKGEGVASLVDVAPTMRAAAGLAPEGLDLALGVPAQRVAVAVGNKYVTHQASARQGSVRVVQPADGPAWQVDLAVDPQGLERRPVAADHALLEVLSKVGLATDGAQREAAGVDMEALRALGYVE